MNHIFYYDVKSKTFAVKIMEHDTSWVNELFQTSVLARLLRVRGYENGFRNGRFGVRNGRVGVRNGRVGVRNGRFGVRNAVSESETAVSETETVVSDSEWVRKR